MFLFGQAFRSKRWARVGSERCSSLARPSGRRLDHPFGLLLGFLGQPKYLNDRPEGRSDLRLEGLAKKERRSLPTPARLSDRKVWPRRNNARFRLRPVSPTGDALNPCLQLFSDWRSQSRLGPTDRGRLLGEDQETDGESKAWHSSQPQYQGPYPVHL